MGANFDGARGLDDGWVKIYTYLLAKYGAWESFENKAPAGSHRRIIQNGTAAQFITAAKRALENSGVFNATDLAKFCAEVTVIPHGLNYNGLSKAARERIRRCEYKSIQDDMEALVDFGLFRALQRGNYGITQLGERCYVYLNHDNDEMYDFRDNPTTGKRGLGSEPAGWRHTAMTFHAPEK
ncbi:hypothetical protein FHS21_004183 [Phyllobacterium trifolii]|uniref:Uncharacterized protein n=1 Tax=Phyllobacterium trifolii TaxID=300193 RepID=A0A839UGG2_9HYPH|nr:hypothetical protein [Phyllobacterium trifolii]MBB3147751.1 hypothetical protein [Phyllobacterium trifolii]